MSVFRVEKNKGYTVMSNHHLRNHALSLKAKGLLSQMLSLPEDWDYTLQGLAQINKESIDAIREAVRELERAGYIKRSRERDERGCLRGTVYTIFEQPHTEPASAKPAQALPALDNPTLEKPMLEKPTLENPTQLTSMIYIRNENLYTLQYLLQKIMSESEFLKSMAQAGMVGISLDAFSRPSETLKFAMCIIAAGPMLVIFPFFQKYFSQGLTIGAVKG